MDYERYFAVEFRKIAKWVGVVLVFLVILVWVVLWARFSANYQGVVQVRKFYNERVLQKRSLPDELPYVMQVQERSDSEYVYELWGKIKTLDYTNYMMTLIDKRGNEWEIQMIHAPYHEANKIGIEIQEFAIDTSGMAVGRAIPLTIDRRAPEMTDPYLANGDMIVVVWKDTLNLMQIDQRNQIGEYTVMLSGDISRPIRKVVAK